MFISPKGNILSNRVKLKYSNCLLKIHRQLKIIFIMTNIFR